MRCLIVEDGLAGRTILKQILSEYGECDLAEDGDEAVAALEKAFEAGKPYDLLCLDIMMPGMDGHEVLSILRDMEAQNGIHGLDGAKVIMMTALEDTKSIFKAFREQCEAYLLKPIRKEKLVECLRGLELIA
jgi:two-component system chemotaxis response regulator CheY